MISLLLYKREMKGVTHFCGSDHALCHCDYSDV